MEKINLKLEKHEDNTSANGKDYTRFLTNEGWFSVFDQEIIENLKKNEGKYVCVGVAKSTGASGKEFKNIRQFHGLAEEGNGSFEVHKEEVRVSEPNRNGTMYASYAKDIFLSIFEKLGVKDKENEPIPEQMYDIMQVAIELVKQAKKAFE